MKQNEIAWALMDIKDELKLYKISKSEVQLDLVMDKLEALENELDFKSVLNAYKKIVYNKKLDTFQKGLEAENKRYVDQYKLLQGVTTFEELETVKKMLD